MGGGEHFIQVFPNSSSQLYVDNSTLRLHDERNQGNVNSYVHVFY